jgi:hypothetical protein
VGNIVLEFKVGGLEPFGLRSGGSSGSFCRRAKVLWCLLMVIIYLVLEKPTVFDPKLQKGKYVDRVGSNPCLKYREFIINVTDN